MKFFTLYTRIVLYTSSSVLGLTVKYIQTKSERKFVLYISKTLTLLFIFYLDYFQQLNL